MTRQSLQMAVQLMDSQIAFFLLICPAVTLKSRYGMFRSLLLKLIIGNPYFQKQAYGILDEFRISLPYQKQCIKTKPWHWSNLV